jgi:hypothetical protein
MATRRRIPVFAAGALAGILVTALLGSARTDARTAADALDTGGFEFSFARTVPGSPGDTWNALTGDVSGWWDHSFSGNPYRLYIEPRPGGGFYEIFDASGDGIRHAVVTAAERGLLLRFEGPLGLAGHAVQMVATFELSEVGLEGTSTNVRVTVRAAGEMHEGWPETVEQVWHHFIDEQFVRFMEAGGKAGVEG